MKFNQFLFLLFFCSLIVTNSTYLMEKKIGKSKKNKIFNEKYNVYEIERLKKFNKNFNVVDIIQPPDFNSPDFNCDFVAKKSYNSSLNEELIEQMTFPNCDCCNECQDMNSCKGLSCNYSDKCKNMRQCTNCKVFFSCNGICNCQDPIINSTFSESYKRTDISNCTKVCSCPNSCECRYCKCPNSCNSCFRGSNFKFILSRAKKNNVSVYKLCQGGVD